MDRNLQGDVLALHLERHWNYERVSQRGSHIKLRTNVPTANTVIVPAHKPVRVGTLFSIVRQVARHKQVSVAEVLRGM